LVQISSSAPLFSNTLSLCSSISVRDQVSHPYKITGKLIVLYILIFRFVGNRREDRRLWAEWYYHNSGHYSSSCLLFKTQRFGDWIPSPSSGGSYSDGPNSKSCSVSGHQQHHQLSLQGNQHSTNHQ
jgi:hypothetical protein